MKTSSRSWFIALALLALATINPPLSTAFAQGTAFTYQGRLNDGGAPANGSYDLTFTLYDSTNVPGNVIAGPVTNSAIAISNGLFATAIDFGAGIFNGVSYWLEISVSANGANAFSTLAPRQPLTPAPYAIFANTASNLSGTLPAGQLSGAVSSVNLSGSYTNAVTFNNGSDEFNGMFSGEFFGPLFVGGSFSGTHFGDGSGLFNLNPALLNGPVPVGNLGNTWKITGNAGTTPGVNFLGTTDNQPLELHVNGQRALQLLPDNSTNNAPDIVGGSLSNALTAGLVGTTISGGAWNTIGPASLFSSNNPYGDFGAYPTLGASYSTIGGGFLNQIQAGATFSTVAGGAINTIQGGAIQSAIGGGFGNTILASAPWSAVAGGTHHTIGSGNGFVGGGWQNTIGSNGSSYSAIVGGLFNIIQSNAYTGFIGGGYHNTIGPDGVLGDNTEYSTIGGGYLNAIYEYDSFIGGGQQNLIGPAADHSVIGGGYNNVIIGSAGPALGVIGGGQANVIQTNSSYDVIGGGFGNTIQSNPYAAVIPGGSGNLAGGANSFAAGASAQATNNGAFVWSDTSSPSAFNSTGRNQFLIRAAGGVGIGTNNPAAALHVVGGGPTNLALRVDNGGIAVSGAGIGTATAAFTHLTVAANTSFNSTFINNPLCNGDANALLFVTHIWNPPNGTTFTYFNKSFGVWYDGNQWAIYTEDTSAMLPNIAFNVLIIKR